MQRTTIELQLDITEINLIIKTLSERPFREVYELIGKIHAQSSHQLQKKDITNITQNHNDQL